jgi:Tol biopolymer transport system component
VFPQERWALGWIDVSSGTFKPLAGLPAGAYAAPRLSPDSTRLAFNTTGAEWDLWTYDLARELPRQLRMEGDQSVPVWTPPTFSQLTFGMLTTGVGRLFSKNPDTLAAPDEVATGIGSGNAMPNAWHPHDGTLAFIQDRAIWFLKQSSPGTPLATHITGAAVDFSPSGDFMAYTTTAGSAVRGQVMVTPYPSHSTHISLGDGCCPVWDRRGGFLYYMRSVAGRQFTIQVIAVPIATKPAFTATAPGKVLFEGPFRNDGPFRNYDVTPDGSKFFVVRQVPPSQAITHIVVDQQWFEILNRATDD